MVKLNSPYCIISVIFNENDEYGGIRVKSKKTKKIFNKGDLILDYIDTYNYCSKLLQYKKVNQVYMDDSFDLYMDLNPIYNFEELQDDIYLFNYKYDKYEFTLTI